jgi:hypothetical protein
MMLQKIGPPTKIPYRLLRAIDPGGPAVCFGAAFEGGSKLDVLPGRELACSAVGKIVNDFGCGLGHETIELAK